jgi:D-alanyl-D-alanine carboxypeptidase
MARVEPTPASRDILSGGTFSQSLSNDRPAQTRYQSWNLARVLLNTSAMRWVTLAFLLGHASISSADEIDDLVRMEMRRHQIPGLALSIIHESSKPRTSTYGVANVELNVPVGPETVFEIGSITKQFTATSILLLSQDGRLTLDDTATRHLQNTPPAWSNITLRHLLTHSSGLRTYTGQSGFEMTKRLTQAQFIAALAEWPLDFKPGDRVKYCNSGYNLLGFIIENVSGTGYWDFVAKRIWSPLGIARSTNRDPAIVIPNRADGYLRRNGVLGNRDSDLTDVFAAGAIAAPIGDLILWNAGLDSGKLLTESSRQQMWTAHTLNDGMPCAYGLGWRIAEFEGRLSIGHSGSTSGFSASMQKFPGDKLTILVLCNSDEPDIATTLARKIARLKLGERKTEPR